MLQENRWLTGCILLCIAAIWGLTFVIVQDAIATIPPFTFIALRFAAATLLLALIFPRQREKKVQRTRLLRHYIGGVYLGVWLFLGYALQTFSLLSTTSGKSGFLTGLYVTIVPLLAWPILHTRPTKSALIGILLAAIGLYLLAFVDLSTLNFGDMLAFLCAIAFALQVVYTGKYSSQGALRSIVIAQLGTVAVLSGIAALLFEPWLHVITDPHTWQPHVLLALAITSIFATALALVAQTYIQRFMSATSVGLILACEPIFAALGDYLWNGVQLGPRAFIGCFCILAGMLVTELSTRKSTKITTTSIE